MIPVILSGGSGTRLWPVSRQTYPKQFCEFFDESLFIKALKRLMPLGSPWTVTVKDLKVLTERSLRELKIPFEQAIYEPEGRNTAPAIAVLCKYLEAKGLGEETVGIFPADHLIADDEAFQKAVRRGEVFARDGHMVTLGVMPTFAATGYGYIETTGPMVGSDGSALQAVGFKEKPTAVVAEEFLAKGGYFWNAGMFIFKVSTMIKLMRMLAPDVWAPVEALKPDLSNLPEVYGKIPKNSIDYAVMEKLPAHVCIPCDFEWTDLGSWDAIAALNRRQASRESHVVEIEAGSNFIVPYGKKSYALVGVEDLIVVDTQDACLITKRGTSEQVKLVVDQFKGRKNPVATQHMFEVRPWGRFDVMKDTSTFKSKVITVDPGQQISYQSHEKRSEHWVIIKGIGQVVLDDSTTSVRAGDYIFVPLATKHRIRNTGTEKLEFVEVQTGTYFGEDDIVRYSDDYQRV